MTAQTPSLQEIIRRRQRASFVGRQAQVAQFRESLLLPVDSVDRRFIFTVHGNAGVGKTFLINQLQEVARSHGTVTACVDEDVYDIPSVMAGIAAELSSQDRPLTNFAKRLATYQTRLQELEDDPHAPEGTPSFLTKAAVRIGVRAAQGVAHSVPVAGQLLNMVDDAALSEQAERLRKYLSKKLRSSDVRLLLSPDEELTPVFIEDLEQISSPGSVALFFDTYEYTAPLIEDWLIGLFGGRYGILPADLIVTLSGQGPLNLNKWSPYLGIIADVPLAEFSETEARQLLIHKGVTDEETASVILALSGRLPLLVATLAENHPEEPVAIGDPTGSAVDRFLKWETDAERRSLALVAAIPRRVNRDVLAIISRSSDSRSIFEWLRRLPFVADHAGRCTYHEIVRSSMLRQLRRESPRDWRDKHSRLADHHRRWRDELSLSDSVGWADPTWQDHRLEETYHRLCANPGGAMQQALSDAVLAYRASSSMARRWAEMIEQAGRDTDSAQVQSWGERLRGGSQDDEAYSIEYLTELLKFGELGHSERIVALAMRGWTLRLTKKYQEAIADFDRAIQLNPKLAWVIASRADTYRLMGIYSEAIINFNDAIQLDANLSWAIADRGVTCLAMRRYGEALRNFDLAIQLDPEYAWAIANRAEVYRMRRAPQDLQRALEEFSRAVRLDPDYAWAIAKRGRVHAQLRHDQEAIEDLTTALDLDPDLAWGYTLRAKVFRRMGRHDDAIADFTRAVQHDPYDAGLIGRRGRSHLAIRSFENALLDFERAIELEPRLDWVIASQAEAYKLMGRLEEALHGYTRALKIDPDMEWAVAGRDEVLAVLAGR